MEWTHTVGGFCWKIVGMEWAHADRCSEGAVSVEMEWAKLLVAELEWARLVGSQNHPASVGCHNWNSTSEWVDEDCLPVESVLENISRDAALVQNVTFANFG